MICHFRTARRQIKHVKEKTAALLTLPPAFPPENRLGTRLTEAPRRPQARLARSSRGGRRDEPLNQAAALRPALPPPSLPRSLAPHQPQQPLFAQGLNTSY